MSTPTQSGGEKLSTSLRPGPESSGTRAARALAVMNPADSTAAMIASASHTATHASA
jgi:hypothetical protein